MMTNADNSWDICFGPIVSKLARQLLTDEIDENALTQIVHDSSCSSSSLSDEFSPVLKILRMCISRAAAGHRLDPQAEQPLRAFLRIVSIKLKTRPIADLLVARPDFCTSPVSELEGREFVRTSFLGPFFALGVAETDDDNFCYDGSERFVQDVESLKDDQRHAYYGGIQSRLGSYRLLIHKIVHALVANTNSREKTLDFLSQMLKLNRKRNQIQGDRSKLASNGVMVNLFSVLLDLSEKIQLDKVQDYYIFQPGTRVDVQDETRIAMSSDQVAEFAQTLDLAEMKPTFSTECFYLTMHGLAVGMNATINHVSSNKKNLAHIKGELRSFQDRIKRRGEAFSRSPEVARQLSLLNSYLSNFAKSIVRDECLVLDEFLLGKCVRFVEKQLALVLRPIATDYLSLFSLPTEVPKTFAAMPELYIESALDFLTFLIKKQPNIFLQNSTNFAHQLLILICCTHLIKNPFLSSKVVTVIFMLCPLYNPTMRYFFSQILNHPVAKEYLFPSLTKFYADVESTGAHTEFYDKFNIRRNIQVIFKAMWEDGAHRDRLIQMAKECTQDFVRFTNMIINDMTFLLDESMSNLKTIHEIETEMAVAESWNNLPAETREQKTNILSDAKRSVKTWLVLGNDTMELFIALTNDNPLIFCQHALGERVASMLNYNMINLCGPTCPSLKLKEPEKYGWDPRALVEQVVKVYLNLSSEQFAENICQDERSYTPEKFKEVINRMTGSNTKCPILGMSDLERFKNLMEMAEQHYQIKMQSEMDYGDDLPDEFKDALCYTLMQEPMRLPSGHVLDSKVILRHLLSDKSNPFTRERLEEKDLVPDLDLKERIQKWVKEKIASKKT